MTNLNHVTLMGNITKDCGADERDFGYAANGQARANITIAVNRSRKQGEEWVDDVSYFDITVWGKTAENLKPYFTKGTKVAIEGYLKQDRWEKEGQKHSRISIVATHVELCGGKKDAENNTGTKTQPVKNESNKGFTGNTANGYVSNQDEFPEDIPF